MEGGADEDEEDPRDDSEDLTHLEEELRAAFASTNFRFGLEFFAV